MSRGRVLFAVPFVLLSCASALRAADDPYRAYADGEYERALQGFVERQVANPEDPRASLEIGSARYKLEDLEGAEEMFGAAARADDPGLAADALYDQGNAAFRQGRLEAAADLYLRSLELDPADEDAKFNLELTLREIQQRQQQQQQPQQGDGGDESESGERKPADSPQQARPPDSPQEAGDAAPEQPKPSTGPAEEGPDRDGDGLPDEVEESGPNPTNPGDPDTDDDGLADGREDANRNGAVDPGETDPNQADSDGDGIPDGQDESPAAMDRQPARDPAAAGAQEMTPEEAERWLQALEEGRPRREDRRGLRRAAPGGKDW